MIASLIQGGLGNQLFQYAAGRAIAEARGESLELDDRIYKVNHIRRYQLPLFNIRARPLDCINNVRVRLALSDRAKPWHATLYSLIPFLKIDLVGDEQKGFDPKVFTPRDRMLLTGFWQTEQYFASIRPKLLQELSFKEQPSLENQKWLQEIDASEAVCIHVRRGDYVQHADLTHLVSDDGLTYYFDAITFIRERVTDPRFYIFSDDPTWVKAHLDAGPTAKFVTHNVGTQDHEDLRLMMRCKHFIIANSTFSWWGAWLSTNADKIVIAPRVWNSQNPSYSNAIVPSGWVRL